MLTCDDKHTVSLKLNYYINTHCTFSQYKDINFMQLCIPPSQQPHPPQWSAELVSFCRTLQAAQSDGACRVKQCMNQEREF